MRPACRSAIPSASNVTLWLCSSAPVSSGGACAAAPIPYCGPGAASAWSARAKQATPSAASANSTPARLERDSRPSSTSSGSPSAAKPSSPRRRATPSGSRWNSARNAGSASSRASSSSRSAMASAPPPQRQGDQRERRDDQENPQHGEAAPHHRRREVAGEHRLVAGRREDGQAGADDRPGRDQHRVAEQRGRLEGVALARQPATQLLERPLAQPRLAQDVGEDLIAVALDARVEVEERPEIRAECQLEEHVAHAPGRAEKAAEREQPALAQIR